MFNNEINDVADDTVQQLFFHRVHENYDQHHQIDVREQDLADATTFSALRVMRMGENEVSSFVMTALSLE